MTLGPITTLILVLIVGFVIFSMLVTGARAVGADFLFVPLHALYTALVIFSVVTFLNVNVLTVITWGTFILAYSVWHRSSRLLFSPENQRQTLADRIRATTKKGGDK